MNKIVCITLAAAMAITSCKKETPAADITKTITLPANATSVVNASNRFAFNFLQATLQQDSTATNKLISPLSIYLALNMTYNGAANATKDSMASALQLSGININDVNAVCQSLINQLPQEDNKVQLSVANSIWYSQNDFKPLPSFLNILQTNYSATAQPLNFNDPSSVKTINNWVAGKTNNKIPEIIENISPGDMMYLINAVYFNGAWQYAFKPSATHNDNFYLQDGSSKSVPFMEQQLTVNMYADSTFTMIELPYGGGKSFSMYIALPNAGQETANTFASLMNANIIESDISKLYSQSIQLYMPKWEYAYSIDSMKPVLSTLGMGIAFNLGADFSAMYDASQVKPYITKAIHKTYIKVDEEGTVAAAATAIGMGFTAVAPSPVLKINHPFFYTIVEKQTGVILFAGIVNDPS